MWQCRKVLWVVLSFLLIISHYLSGLSGAHFFPTTFLEIAVYDFHIFITSSSSSNWFNSRTYSQIHTPTVVQGEGGGWNPSPEFLICCSISKRFYLQWNAFDLLNKMRYILWVVTLLEACDVNSNGRHLGRHLRFYQELEIRLKELCHKIQPN